jgi:hypothetical protein
VGVERRSRFVRVEVARRNWLRAEDVTLWTGLLKAEEACCPSGWLGWPGP